MADIDQLIQDLKSHNSSKRYEACEELRVASTIPEEAISVLREVTLDPNPDVADASQQALNLHTNSLITFQQYDNGTNHRDTRKAVSTIIGFFILFGLIVFLFLIGVWWFAYTSHP